MPAITLPSAFSLPFSWSWLLGRKAALQLAGIVALALAILGASAFVTERTHDARGWVRHTREVQLAIDKLVWNLLELQQAMQSQRMSRDAEAVQRFNRLRAGVRDDTERAFELTHDNSFQQRLLVQYEETLAHYLTMVDQVAASELGSDIARTLAPAMIVDGNRMSALIGAMRLHEDELLEVRSRRAENLIAALLPTLCFSAAFIALLVVIAARSVNAIVHARDVQLSNKDSEIAAKVMMMREVDHRVRNSLGLVYNVMTFQQMRKGIDDTTREFLAETANQVLVVARVHERLYKSSASDTVGLREYLRDLCDDMAAYSLPASARNAIKVRGAEIEFPAEPAISLGLVVVEFVTNALKYSSPSEEAPIFVDVAGGDADVRIVISDHGQGLPETFEPRDGKGLGMQVIDLLVKQLRATLTVDRAWSGARFVLTVPNPVAVAETKAAA